MSAIQMNGFKFPTFLIIPALVFTFWLGGLSLQVAAQDEAQDAHEKKPSHDATVADVATIKADVKHNKEAVEKVEKKLDDIERKIDDNQKELLNALADK